MNFKVIGVYTAIYFALGILFGFFDALLNSQAYEEGGEFNKAYFYGEYLVSIVVSTVFFSYLFRQKIKYPIISAGLIVVLSWAVDAVLVYLIASLTPVLVLVLFGFSDSAFGILIAFALYYYKAGKTGNA